jgi:antirestriction protein ArdC
MPPKLKTDVAQIITDLILEKLKSGTGPWVRPWTGSDGRPKRHNGAHYTGINTIYLWAVADAHGFKSPYWMTFKQAAALGGTVRKGEHGAFSVYYSRGTKREQNRDTGEMSEKSFGFLKHYHVFNADQIEGLPDHYYPEPDSARVDPIERRDHLRAFYESVPIMVKHMGTSAYYSPSSDMVVLPRPGDFKSMDFYATTRFHELVHATGNKERLDRKFGKRFGDKAYAFEELVACIGQSVLCAEFGLPNELQDDHASYIASWISVLEGDKMAIIHAAAKAEQAVSWLRQHSSVIAETPVEEAEVAA